MLPYLGLYIVVKFFNLLLIVSSGRIGKLQFIIVLIWILNFVDCSAIHFANRGLLGLSGRQVWVQDLSLILLSISYIRFLQLDGIWRIRERLSKQEVRVDILLATRRNNLRYRNFALLLCTLLILNWWQNRLMSGWFLGGGWVVDGSDLLGFFFLDYWYKALFIVLVLWMSFFWRNCDIYELLLRIISYEIVPYFVELLVTLIFLRERVFKTTGVDDKARVALQYSGIHLLIDIGGHATRGTAWYICVVWRLYCCGDMRVP